MSRPAVLHRVEYPETDRSIRSLTPREIAEELNRKLQEKLKHDPGARGIKVGVVVSTTQFNTSTRAELLVPKFGSFERRVTSEVAQIIDSMKLNCWTSAKIIEDEDSGKIAVEVSIRT